MAEEKSEEMSLKLWMLAGAACVLMALFITMAVVCVSLAIQLKEDSAAIHSALHAEKNKAPDHTHPVQDHTHPPQRPPLVAFSVATKQEFESLDKRIPMEVIIYNDGNYFRSDNAFYAPHKGVYAFAYGATARANTELVLLLCKKKDGASEKNVALSQTKALGEGTKDEYGSTSGHVIIQLDEGEQVYLKLHCCANGGILKSDKATPPSTYFTGELKQKLD